MAASRTATRIIVNINVSSLCTTCAADTSTDGAADVASGGPDSLVALVEPVVGSAVALMMSALWKAVMQCRQDPVVTVADVANDLLV